MGKGGAIIEGFKIATGDIIGFVDADESVKPSQVIAMIDELSNADGVIASRHLNDSKIIVKQPLKRRFASKFLIFLLDWYLAFLLGTHIVVQKFLKKKRWEEEMLNSSR